MKNPYDGGFKILAEDHPELLLRLLGIVAPGEKPHITSVLRELQLDALQIDHAFILDNASIVQKPSPVGTRGAPDAWLSAIFSCGRNTVCRWSATWS